MRKMGPRILYSTETYSGEDTRRGENGKETKQVSHSHHDCWIIVAQDLAAPQCRCLEKFINEQQQQQLLLLLSSKA